MDRVEIIESGLSHVGITTDVLLSMAGRVLTDERPDLLNQHEKIQVNLTWVDDKEMATLNKKYRGKDQPTDVLSFSYLDAQPDLEAKEPEFSIGDMIISLDTLKRQAKERGHEPQAEAEVLFVHGLLHILGYDHELGPKELMVMLARERKYLGDNAGLIERSALES
jgi:probable rRNA maturation factor